MKTHIQRSSIVSSRSLLGSVSQALGVTRLRILPRVILTLFLPIVGLVGASGYVATVKYQESSKLADVRELAEIAPDISALVHEMQKERGVSAGYIGSKGVGIPLAQVESYRQLTDAALGNFSDTVEGVDTGRFGAEFEQQIDEARDALLDLGEVRDRVARFDLTVGEMAASYTGTISSLLAIIHSTAQVSADDSVNKSIAAYVNFLEAKERAGQERAMGANGFGAGVFSQVVHQKFTKLGAAQDTLLRVFRENATESQTAFERATLKGPEIEEFGRLRNLAAAGVYGGSLEGITGTHWFDVSTARIDLMKKVEDRLSDDLVSLARTKGSAGQSAFMLLSVLVVLFLFVTTLIVLMSVRSIVDPVNDVSVAMNKISDGNLETEVPGTGQGGEIGGMANSLQRFKDSANAAMEAEKEQEIERAEKQRRAEGIARLCDQFAEEASEVLQSFTAAATQMRGTSESLNGIASNCMREADQATDAARETLDNVQAVASASEELTSSIAEIASQMSSTTAVSKEAITASHQAGETAVKLNEAAENIGSVVELIADIASQTNLLALNATIEAARAGEAGKGFAVVASEVKTLSTQTESATQEISREVDTMRNMASEVAGAIEKISGIIARVDENATTSAAAVEEQDAAAREISGNVQTAAQKTTDVTGNVSRVSEATTETGHAASEVLQTSDELAKQSQALNDRMQKFIEDLRTA